MLTAAAGAGLFAGLPHEALASGGGTVELVVRAEEVDVPLVASDGTVAELKAEAREAQEPVVEYAEETDGLEVKNQFWLANALLLEVDTGEVDVERLLGQEGVARVHENFRLELPEPQAGETNADETTYGLDQIRTTEVWDTYDTTGEGAKIAVLDTGVDPDHPDFEIDPENFAEFDSDGDEVEAEPYDSGYHGTHVSGTVVGAPDPEGEVPSYGVAPGATLLHGLVLPDGGGSFAQIIGGMEWAVENDADAINMSLGAGGYFAEMIEPVRNAERAGTFVISSSGNDGAGTSGSPGNVYESFSIGASDEDEGITSFSSGELIDTEAAWGGAAPDEWPDTYVVPDVAAPGEDVLSAIPEDESLPVGGCGAGDLYCAVSGTSMAAPHVAGVAALMVSAAEDDLTVEQAKAALESTAFKPDGESDDQDTRYGHGIVDAFAATGRVAGQDGVTGTVTNVDGEPLEGATVTLDGFPVETDADGEYRIRAHPGEHEVTAEAFGHGSQTRTVTVEDGFTPLDFELSTALEIGVIEGQPEGLEAGEAFDLVVQVANLDAVTVNLGGDYEGGAELLVDGEETGFGERVTFEEPLIDELTITVETHEDGEGDLELEHVFEGAGETITRTTGPTVVFDDGILVGVVDVEAGPFGDDLVEQLGTALPARYVPERVDAAEALDAVEADTYSAYVVQSLGDDARAEAFAEATAPAEIGVVWLDQFGEESAGISQLADATGDPRQVLDAVVEFFFPPPPSVSYSVEESHPIFEGVAGPGERVELYEPIPIETLGGFHTYFEDYEGPIAGEVLAEVETTGTHGNDGLAVDELSSTVLAASLGFTALATPREFTDDAAVILANAVETAAETPPVRVRDLPDARTAPGDELTWHLEVDELVELEVGLADTLGIGAGDLRLLLDGEQLPFGESVTFDEPLDGEVELTVETFEDTVGRFSLDPRFVARGRGDAGETVDVTFRPTSVYDSPVRVPRDVDTIQEAVDLVAEGEEIVVEDGVYEEDEPDRGFQSGLYVGTDGVTIRAAEGADPVVVHARDVPAPNVVNVDADDVTIEGLTVNVIDGEVDEKNSIGQAIRINEAIRGATGRGVTSGGTSGVFLDANVSDVHIEDVTVIDSAIGVGTDLSGGPVADVTITDVTTHDPPDFGWGGVYVENATGITVTDCEIEYPEGYDAGVLLFGDFTGSEDNRVANNAIVGPADDDPFLDGDCGVFVDDADAVVENNHIVDAYVGVRVGDLGLGDGNVRVEENTIEGAKTGFLQMGDLLTLERNVVEADTGLQFDGGFSGVDADAILARDNDLSATALPFAGEPDSFGPDGPFDCRLNYLGDRDYEEPIADGDVAYEPFLTEPPEDADDTTIGVDLTLDAGESYGLGVPGPTDATVWDLLGADGAEDFAGSVEFWNHNSDRWQAVTGEGELQYVDTLYAFKVTPEEGVRAVVEFQRADDPPVGPDGTPPGHRDAEPDRSHLREGWNFVAAPAYGDEDEVFGGDAIEEVDPELASPGSQLGDAEKNAFTGYKVSASEDSWLKAGIDAYDPTMEELYEGLGLDPTIHEEAGAGAEPADLELSAGDLFAEIDDEDRLADALAALFGRTVADALETAGEDEATAEVVDDALAEATADTPDHEAVEEALGRVLSVALPADTVAWDDEPEDYDAEAARLADDGTGERSSLTAVVSALFGD